MSLFGSLMGDFDDDIFGNHMNAMNMQMRSMNRLMNSFMPDPFNMLTNFDSGFQQNALMERQGGHNMGGLFGFPSMPNMNRLLSADIGNNGSSFCSSSVITMSSGPDGRPQIYQASSSTKTGPGGIRETRRSVQDSVNGVKKMAIGHHIGERAHIIEKEQDLHSGQLEEHQEFINLEEEQAEDFDREFTTKARSALRHGGNSGGYAAIAAPPPRAITIEPIDDDDDIEDVDLEQQSAVVRHPSRPSSAHSARRQMPSLPTPQTQPQNSSTDTVTTATTPLSSSSPSPSSSNTPQTPTPTAIATPTNIRSVSSSTLPTYAAAGNQYMHATPRRAHHRNTHLTGGITTRRPLRTPSSSPLIMSSTVPSHSSASTPSVHPHPYNNSAARRNHHRSKQHSKAEQQQHKHHHSMTKHKEQNKESSVTSKPK